jgi:hypothetical protein
MNTKQIFWKQAFDMLWSEYNENETMWEAHFKYVYSQTVSDEMINYIEYRKINDIQEDNECVRKNYYLDLIISMPDEICRYRFFNKMILIFTSSQYYDNLKVLFALSPDENNVKLRLSKVRASINTDYINGAANKMMQSIEDGDTESAIGQAKELIETVCKFILKQENIEISKDRSLLNLYKQMTKILYANNDESEIQEFIKKMLNGFSIIIHSIIELRNKYGTGHGKNPDFKPLEKRYAQLAVGAATDIALFFLSTYEENNNITIKIIDQ